MTKKVMIIGAGFAGVKAALTFAKKARLSDDVEVTIINKNSVHTMITDLHKVAANKVPERGITVPINDIIGNKNIKLVIDTIDKIDYDNKILVSSTKEYAYDYLVVAMGSKPNFYGIPGMEENCFPLWFMKDAVAIREHVKNCFQKAASMPDSADRTALLTFVVGGGGFTGIEMAGELSIWIKKLCRQHKIARSHVRLIIVEAQAKILPLLGQKNIDRCVNCLNRNLDIEIMTNSMISKLNTNSVEFKSGEKLPTKTLIWTAGITAANIGTNLTTDKTRGNRIPVNQYTQTEHKDVYAIGDICAFGEGKNTLPPMVEPAEQLAVTCVENILAQIRGESLKPCKPALHGTMVSVGSRYAVAEIMGFQLPVVMSFAIKHVINMYWLFSIAGIKPVINYVLDEVSTFF